MLSARVALEVKHGGRLPQLYQFEEENISLLTSTAYHIRAQIDHPIPTGLSRPELSLNKIFGRLDILREHLLVCKPEGLNEVRVHPVDNVWSFEGLLIKCQY